MATAVVSVRVRCTGVVNVEQPVVQVLVIVTADVETRVRRVEVPVIARMPNGCTGDPVFIYLLLKGQTPSNSPLREFLEATAAVSVRARCTGVVNVEQPAAQVLAIETADEETRARRAEVPVIARICCITA